MIRLLLALWLAAAAAGEPALTNEDIVRMVARGVPEAEILQAVAARPPAYEVSEEMLEELRLAGVPEPVAAAMRARQAAASPSPVAPTPPRRKVRVVVALSGDKALKAPAKVPDAIAERLRLPADEESLRIRDLAVYLACVTPEHVPDQWRSKSPLGRDLDGTTRHEIIVFHAGETPSGTPPTLALPPQLDAEVDDVEAHDLILGVAARIGDRWRSLGQAKKIKVRVDRGEVRLAGRIGGGGIPLFFRVELSDAQSASETSLETPASSIVTP